jgi:hypothetical protein
VLLFFLLASIVTGAVGVVSLISSGFFKNIRERQLRTELALLEQKRKALEEINSPINQPIPESPQVKTEAEAISVTEHTTRELR